MPNYPDDSIRWPKIDQLKGFKDLLPKEVPQALKFDEEKIRWDLLPWDGLEEIVKVLMFGATKYGEYNWTKGMAWQRLGRAAIGHIIDWLRGRNVDNETGISHLAHAGCCILFLLAYSVRGIGEDNRPMKNEVKNPYEPPTTEQVTGIDFSKNIGQRMVVDNTTGINNSSYWR